MGALVACDGPQTAAIAPPSTPSTPTVTASASPDATAEAPHFEDAHFEDGHFEDGHFEDGHFEDGRRVDEGVAEARRLVEGDDPAGAIALLDPIVGADPADADGWLWRGLAIAAQGDPERARADLQRASDADPTFVRPLQEIADLYVQARDCAGAAPWLEKILQMRPDDPVAWFNRGHCRYRAGDLEGALDDAHTACGMGHELSCKTMRRIEGRMARSP